MKSGPSLLVLMIIASTLALVPKRLRRRMRPTLAPPPPQPRKGPSTRMTWTAADEAEWGDGGNTRK
ncbi:MAG: hypothetical protein ACEQSB_01170 [Undibacterium sp.]